MSEYIIEIPDEYFASCDTERDMYYPDERDSAMPITPLVRCRDCKRYNNQEPGGEIGTCNIGLEDLDLLSVVDPDGFCAWGERRQS